MKHHWILYAAAGLVAFFTLLQIELPENSTPTGAAITEETDNAYAVELHNIITDFFGINGIDFPDGNCGEVAKELYANIAFVSLDTTAGYGTTGSDRIATLNFVVGRTEKYGTLDMAKGNEIIGDGPTDSFISLNSEAVVRVPKEGRTTYFSMNLYGTSQGNFIATHGSFSTPSVDCKFVTRNGEAICDCNSHPITGIRIAGITGLRPV